MNPTTIRRLFLCFCITLAGRSSAAVTLSLGDATIALDAQGRVTSVRAADGHEYAPGGGPPAFEIVTRAGVIRPTAVERKGNVLTVAFGDRDRIRLTVSEGRGFAVLKLAELVVKDQVERLQLFCLPVKGPQTIGSIINACYDDHFATAVMGTEINVHPRVVSARAGGGDNKNCTHRLEQVTEPVKEGQHAARFTATSERDDNAGWSVVGKSFAAPLDLRGCKAVRAWVHGDGSGESLKIQLTDGLGGYRDDYIKIDFTGWRQVVCQTPALNTLRYDHVRGVNFYYNSMPAKRTVTCLLDQVEAVMGEKTVTLEDFEDGSSELWPFPATRLYAETLNQFGIQPAGVGIIACPRQRFEQTIERFEQAAGLPSPHPDGVWSKLSPRTKHSYLFITSFGEADVDDVITFARRGGFDSILIGQESWCASTGHYPVNIKHFPGGLDFLKKAIARLKRAGFKVGLHYLAPSIYPPDSYLTPVPDHRLVRDAMVELGDDIDPKTDFIPTKTPPEKFPAEDGGYDGSGTVIQIDDELIRYRERSLQQPFGFRGCTRGAFGTTPTPHVWDARVAHLLRSYGYFLFDMDTDLINEVADNFAHVANACDIDMIYWDGSERLQGEHWYYNAKLHKAFYDRLRNKNIFAQGSSYNHYSWHIISREASADGHGDLKGYLDERTPGFASYRANLMPIDIGWYYVYDTKTTTDQFEYVLNKSLGHNSSISLQTSPKHIREHPYIGEIIDLVGAYERLRLGGKVPEETRARLREPKRDYHLVKVGRELALQRVIYEPSRDVTALDGKSNVWEIEVKDAPCRVGVQLHVPAGQWAQPGPSYRSEKSQLLEDFEKAPHYNGGTHAGVTQKFEIASEGAVEGKHCAVYTATSTLGAKEGWSAVGRSFNPPLNLAWHKGIGFWLRGDGGGGQFKLQLRDGHGATDYYITNDYVGWRYQQLARPALDPIDYRRVSGLSFYYNGMPAKTTVTCAIDGVRALPSLDEPVLKNPTVEIGGKTLAWPATLRGGQTLTYRPDEATRVTGAGNIASPPALTLAAGRHTIRFTCSQPMAAAVTVGLMLEPTERLPVASTRR